MSFMNAERWLGLCAILFALLLLFVWIPNDIDTGAFEKVRRRLTIGDSLGPIVAGCVILIGGLFTILRPEEGAPMLKRSNVVWMLTLLAVIGTSIAVMRFAGPVATELFADDPYRALRATFPWKYIGYVLGGGLLVYLLIGVSTASWHPRYLALGLAAALVMALLYDLPFEDLLLPPNGDV